MNKQKKTYHPLEYSVEELGNKKVDIVNGVAKRCWAAPWGYPYNLIPGCLVG